jgi:hypothetical protein
MRVGATVMLCVALGVVMNASADEDKRRESRYPKPFYTLRATESKDPGVQRMKLDNRTLEITLPEPAPDEFFMPEAVRTNVKNEAYEKALLNQKVPPFQCFSAGWHYGLLRGVPFSGDGGIGASIKVVPNPFAMINDPSYSVPIGTVGNDVSHHRIIELDYFKLDDFIRAVHSDTNTNPYWVETINGRQWVREVRWLRREQLLRDMPPRYHETFYTPVDRQRILTVSVILAYGIDYDIPEDMPWWMRELSGSITTMLRSIKLSPPDDGSPDPFLIDPEQKPGTTPIVFPASRPYPAPPPLAKP